MVKRNTMPAIMIVGIIAMFALGRLSTPIPVPTIDPCTTVQNVTVWPAGVRWKSKNLYYNLQPGRHYSLTSAQREALVLDCQLRKER